MIAAKAERIIWGGQEERDHPIGKGFWWAKGREALNQDWQAGDFSTWINQAVEVKAFGVSFDFVALSELVPADKQAIALRRFSVLANEEWISASDMYSAMQEKVGLELASAALAEACRLGQLGARAMRASCTAPTAGENVTLWQAVEWDVPLWFWRDCTTPKVFLAKWALGKVSGEAHMDGLLQRIELQGLHFHRSGLVNLGLEDKLGAESRGLVSRRGRKPEHQWLDASMAIWGLIFRGELMPENQAAIEKAFQAYLAKGDKEPSESTVRPWAKRIWDEYSKA